MRALGLFVFLGLLSAAPANAVTIGASVDLSLRSSSSSGTDTFNGTGLTGGFSGQAEVLPVVFPPGSRVDTRGRGFVSPPGDFGSTAPAFPSDPAADIFEASFISSAFIGLGPGGSRSGNYTVDYVLTFTTDGPVKFVLNELEVVGFETNRMAVKFGLLGSSSPIIDESFSNDKLQISGLTKLLSPGTYEFSIFADESSAGFQVLPDLDIEMSLGIYDVTEVPLPASFWLLVTGLALLNGRKFLLRQ